jgi:hypothetical protein
MLTLVAHILPWLFWCTSAAVSFLATPFDGFPPTAAASLNCMGGPLESKEPQPWRAEALSVAVGPLRQEWLRASVN